MYSFFDRGTSAWIIIRVKSLFQDQSGKGSREIILPKESTHDAARNTLLKEVEQTGAFKNGSNKYIGRLESSYGYGK